MTINMPQKMTIFTPQTCTHPLSRVAMVTHEKPGICVSIKTFPSDSESEAEAFFAQVADRYVVKLLFVIHHYRMQAMS